MELAGVLAERFRTNSEDTPPWDFQAAAPVARFVTPSARSQFAAFNASAGIARWIPAAGTVRSLYFREPRSRYQVRFAKSRAPATEVQRNERAFARTAVSRSTTSRTRVPEFIGIYVGSLDGAVSFKPAIVLYASRGHAWDFLDPDIPKLPEWYPNSQ